MNPANKSSDNIPTIMLKTWGVSFCVSNVSFAIGFPTDRLKVAIQTNRSVSAFQACSEIIKGGPSRLYEGCAVSWIRHQLKILQRTPLLTELPRKIDQCVEGMPQQKLIGNMAKSLLCCGIDCVIGNPFEVVRTQQMKQRESAFTVIKKIAHHQGLRGFAHGLSPSLAKSFPAWFNVFFSHSIATEKFGKDKNQMSFKQQLFSSTVAAIPITLLTSPWDTVKSNMQNQNLEKNHPRLGVIHTIRSIVSENGLLFLWRGSVMRIFHRQLNLMTAFIIMDFYNARVNKG